MCWFLWWLSHSVVVWAVVLGCVSYPQENGIVLGLLRQVLAAIGQLDDSIALIWLSVNYFFLHLLHETSEAYTNVLFISVPAGIDGLAVQ
ncbi:hypothetical protein GGR22_000844 [Flavobacterium gossypii]|uniref:Secreted protein n=1 Tax=Flavobacterium gossypii TaxID=1646119 RepID=A0ABR6DM14_9FLAO|nr:hypothetical protein [Flavobacterium gossypii]